MAPTKGIFIGATGQDVGKTTCCLGILAGLTNRFDRLGFIKPVGQRHVKIGEDLHVDKDVVLFKEHFGLRHDYASMSPVILPQGFTREYLDGLHDTQELMDRIHQAYDSIRAKSDVVVVEGTGHVGVGTIVDVNNAKVCAALDLDMIIIAPGGLGSSFDELALNVALCQQHDVKIAGVILNRVLPEKRQMLEAYVPKALARWNIPLIGCIPYDHFLSLPTMRDFEGLFQAQLIAGRKHQFRRFADYQIGARTLNNFRESHRPQQLTIVPAGREDLIDEILDLHAKVQREEEQDYEGGLILTGRHPPEEELAKRIQASDIPTLFTHLSSYHVLERIHHFTAKTRKDDTFKVREAIRLVENHLNFDLICP